MNMQIEPRPLHGSIAAIPSKSAAHRLLICAALADQPTKLLLSGGSADIYATVSCLRALGAQIEQQADGLCIRPIQQRGENPLLDCQESGSTLRFLLPVAAALCPEASFQGSGRLPQLS